MWNGIKSLILFKIIKENSMNSPILTLVALGMSLLLFGGFLGSQISKRQQIDEDLLKIRNEHKAMMDSVKVCYQKALEFDQKALGQIDSVYKTIALLTNQEGKVRATAAVTRQNVIKQQVAIDNLRNELSQEAKKSKLQFE